MPLELGRKDLETIYRDRSKAAIGTMTSLFSMSHDNYPIFADEVKKEHRTHQGSLFRAAAAVIIALAENADEGRTDARNEAACLMAQQLRNFMQEQGEKNEYPVMMIVHGTLQVPYI